MFPPCHDFVYQLEQQQSEKVSQAEKTDNSSKEESVIQLMKSKASFLLKLAGFVNVQSRVEVTAACVTVDSTFDINNAC